MPIMFFFSTKLVLNRAIVANFKKLKIKDISKQKIYIINGTNYQIETLVLSLFLFKISNRYGSDPDTKVEKVLGYK